MAEGPPPPSPVKHLLRELTPVAAEFYRRLAEHGRPSTTTCARCQRTGFPPRLRCPTCGGAQEWVELPLEGRLHAFTTQETALRFTAPAVLALVELGPVVVPGVLHQPYEQLAIGQPVTLRPFTEPQTGFVLLEFRPRRPATAR